ncbi:MAG: N-acetylglucosamine-6-phosphate deacetylase [Lachnospiraceae bacterium]
MKWKNCNIFCPDGKFHFGDLEIRNGKIAHLVLHRENVQKDADFLVPGFIDTHLHGCNGFDFSDGTTEAIYEIARFQLLHGITSYCPATMTLPISDLEKIADAVANYRSPQTVKISAVGNSAEDYSAKGCIAPESSSDTTPVADFLGYYMEGPFFSAEKAGAQRTDCLRQPDFALFSALQKRSHEQIVICALAPELEGSREFIQSCGAIVSLGHSVAQRETIENALNTGAERITHLYNGMRYADDYMEIGSRYPNCYAELICDGVHNSKERIIRAFQSFGDDRIVLISDSMRATGLGDGIYTLGGQNVSVTGKLALLAGGQKAGSVSTLYDCFITAISLGLAPESALKAVTINPAKSLHREHEIGKLAPGYPADFLLLNSHFERKAIIKNGKKPA